MSITVERRKAVVTLYQGDYQARLDDLIDRAAAALRDEAAAGPVRAGQKSKAMQLGREHDALLAEAEAAAVQVTLTEISHAAYQKLADEHPPRTDKDDDGKPAHPEDRAHGVNMKSFPGALLRASLADDLSLDDLSQLHYIKLERAAWNLHAGDDALGKFSLVSRLTELRGSDSKPQPDSE